MKLLLLKSRTRSETNDAAVYFLCFFVFFWFLVEASSCSFLVGTGEDTEVVVSSAHFRALQASHCSFSTREDSCFDGWWVLCFNLQWRPFASSELNVLFYFAHIEARVTVITCQWLMGPCKVNTIDLPNGEAWESGVIKWSYSCFLLFRMWFSLFLQREVGTHCRFLWRNVSIWKRANVWEYASILVNYQLRYSSAFQFNRVLTILSYCLS